MNPRILLLALALLSLAMLRPSGAQSMSTAAADSGLIIGVTAVEKPDPTQLDLHRNIRIYTFLYNSSPVRQVIDWRTRRLRSARITAEISDHDYYGTFIVDPGEVVLMKSFYYYRTGFPGPFTFSVRDENQTIYSVPAVPMATNRGRFETLPPAVQQRLIDVFLENQPSFRWWYKQY